MGIYPGGNIVKLTPSDLSATAYTEGDIIFAKNEIKNAVPSRGGCSLLRSVSVFAEGAIAEDNLAIMFFDNSTALGAAANDAGTDITADEFRTASCIGMLTMDGDSSSFAVGNGRLYGMNDSRQSSPLLLQASVGETSIWVAMVSHAGTLNLTDTDSITCTFGFEYLG